MNFETGTVVSTEISKKQVLPRNEIKDPTVDKDISSGATLGVSDLKSTIQFNKSNISDTTRRDKNGETIIKGKKLHKVMFRDCIGQQGNSKSLLVDVVEIESFKQFNRLYDKFQLVDKCTSCSTCLIV